MASRRFSMTPTDDDGPTLFTLDGHLWAETEDRPYVETDEAWEETFTLLPDIPPGAIFDVNVAAELADDGTIGWGRHAIARFIRAVILPADEARWDRLIRDKTRWLQTECLRDVMFWVIGEKTGRPIGRRPSSSDGSPNENTGSEAEPSPAAETTAGSTAPD